MSEFRKKIIASILFIGITSTIFPQSGLLNREDLLVTVREVLSLMYNYEFDKAREKFEVIQQEIPEHPATCFFEALLIYWEKYPLIPEDRESASFLRLMDQTMNRAEAITEQNPDDLEGIFFSLFSKAFYSMFWADNGKPNKVIPLLPSMYRQTLKGMERKDEFVEFYFSTGLYNYYIEAYPEKHPIYKPLIRLFKRGNLTEGLKELLYCSENAIYLRVEAKYFLCLLFMGYENDPKKASELAAELYREFPRNACYQGNYAYTLLFDRKYPVAEIIIKNLAGNADPFSTMQTHILNGYLLEKYYNEYSTAFREYEEGLRLAERFGPFPNSFRAMAWMGIGRHYKREGDMRKANYYFRLAKNASPYQYLTEDK